MRLVTGNGSPYLTICCAYDSF